MTREPIRFPPNADRGVALVLVLVLVCSWLAELRWPN